MHRAKVLAIDDDADVLLALELLLKENGHSVTVDTHPANIPSLLKACPYDVVFLDMNFAKEATDGKEGLHWLREIRARDPDATIVPLTAFGDVDLAVRAMKEGAADFILKPWKNEKLLGTLSMVLQLRESRREIERLRSQRKQLVADMDQQVGDMIGRCDAMQRVFALIHKVAATDANVLVMGENGTGKELVARALHRQSLRAAQVFIGVDMASIVDNLFESELFGHVRGAFTDARENRVGRFESATGGTLFLDEIGNLPLAMQAKLLRAIETQEVTPVGSNKPRPIDIRLICATNMPVHEMVTAKEFRQDLLYRINTIEIRLPPLRERREDIPLLIEHFASQYYRKYKIFPKKMPRQTIATLQEYDWPGQCPGAEARAGAGDHRERFPVSVAAGLPAPVTGRAGDG